MENIMNGLELSRKYFEEVGRPAFEKACPLALERGAVGLVGEGSECFGFDDEISRDHDWGPGFCIWLAEEDYKAFGEEAAKLYDSLPKNFMGFERQRVIKLTSDRVGVHSIPEFYSKYIGLGRAPETFEEWFNLPERFISKVTNGEVWQDPLGEFSKIRNALIAYYPEPVRKRKIAMHAELAAQAGQYNYYRCMQRGNVVAASHALDVFLTNVEDLVFLLNLKYCPYYKWAYRALKALPILGAEVGALMKEIVLADTTDSKKRGEAIEKISALIIAELKRQGLSNSNSDFLLHHAQEMFNE